MTRTSPSSNEIPSALLADLYGGIDGDRPWVGFLESLSEWMDASYSVLIIASGESSAPGTFLAPGADPQRSADYIESFFADDPFRGLPDGRVASFTDFMEGMPADRHAAYLAYLKLAGGEQVLGIDIRLGARLDARFRVMRTDDRPEFSREERDQLQGLVPHLRIAARLFEKIEFHGAQHRVFHSAVDGFGVGVLILDRDFRIVSSNALAEQLLDEAEGLRRAGDALSIADRHPVQLLSGLLFEPLSADRIVRFRIERPVHGDLAATARAIELPAIHCGTGALALFLARPGSNPPIDPEALRILFGLTPAETRLALLIAGGHSLIESAQALGISHNTAKTQLRGIFAKTQTNRQADLLRALSMLAG